jgi:isopenicillin-N epimerase
MLDAARARMAAVVGCPADDMAFVRNATEGVGTVLNSLRFAPGDELLTSAHEYNACNNVLRAAAERWGAKVVHAALPWPVPGPGACVEAVLGAVTARTRLALVSHVTSPTGFIMPVERITSELARRGVETLVDGAHAPGFLPLDVSRVAPAYYTGNFHKWLCAPKGSAFLYVRRDLQAGVRPLVISHGANAERTDRSRFRLEFDYTGTADYAAWLATPAAVDALIEMVPGGGGLGAVMAQNRGLALAGRRVLMERFGGEPLVPEEMLGAMAAVAIPARSSAEAGEPTRYHDPLHDRLVARHRIQVPIIPFPAPPRRHVRISAQLYNTLEQYAYLADAIAAECGVASLR